MNIQCINKDIVIILIWREKSSIWLKQSVAEWLTLFYIPFFTLVSSFCVFSTLFLDTFHPNPIFHPIFFSLYPLCHNKVCFIANNFQDSELWPIGIVDQTVCSYFFEISLFSRLSLALNKDVCDWLRQTLNPSELKVSDQSKPELIHTSCRSESSNISLVVLDKDSESQNLGPWRLFSPRMRGLRILFI